MDSYNDRILRSIKYADNQCRKARTGSTPFSIEAQRIMGALRVQKLMMWRIKLRGRVGRPRKRRLRRLALRYGYEGDISISDLPTVKLLIKNTSLEYKIFRPKAHEFRATYLGRIADELAMEDGVSR